VEDATTELRYNRSYPATINYDFLLHKIFVKLILKSALCWCLLDWT